MDVFERRLCDQAQKLYVIKTCFMTQINPKKISPHYYKIGSTCIAGHSFKCGT